ncbi:MAG: NERD domain-containing protein [Alicyclobacillus sp.]|uniref:nuclease-related domain-containing protein n=1 Tax=Alicyclobacillus herbarius TaxID=122960 RepID=UPI0009D6554E|nr:NERD domain-containing protein [Alicyclobacillus sp.]
MESIHSRPAIFRDRSRTEVPTEGESHILKILSEANLPGWTIYEQPHLNGDRPDIILVNPDKGVIIIEVKDGNLSNGRYRYSNDQYIQGLDSSWKWKKYLNPISQCRKYANNIYHSTYVNLMIW